MSRLLVIDDERNLLYSLKKGLQSDAIEVITASTARQGLALVEEQRPDAIILDIRLTDMPGLEVFDRIREIDPRLPVIVITAYATTETAIEAMKRGAFEYLLKPLDFPQLRDLVSKAVELSRLRHVPAVFEDTESAGAPVERILGRSPAMQEVYKAIGRVAGQDVTVLILGESGTGKELVARALFHHSRRKEGPFLAFNCAAIPESLLESELFGHERGAFTGANRRRIGKFEQANHGTLFLDEIGDMAASVQAKMLRLLQEQRFERVGGNESIQTDVRIIAATNQSLEELVAAGQFRRDLFYRLKVFTIHLPPLRDRLDDLPVLAEHFIKQFSPPLGKHVAALSAEALQLFQAYAWPGNIRELQSTIKAALVRATGNSLTLECLPPEFTVVPAAEVSTLASATNLRELERMVEDMLQAGESDIYRKACHWVDRTILETMLRHVKGNQMQASELLGIARSTLRAKLRMVGLVVERQVGPEQG